MAEAAPKTDDSIPSSSRSNELSKTLPEDAFNKFIQGKRHILVQDYSSAVQCLSVACEMYCQHYGELANECGEICFLYGKSLFRLSQQTAGILGGALREEVNEEDEDDQSEEEEEEDENKKEEKPKEEGNGKTDNTETANVEENSGDSETASNGKELSEPTDSPQEVVKEDDEEKVKNEDTKEDKEKDTKDEVKEGEQATKEADATLNKTTNEEEEQQEDDLELAWNSLETAKSIFLRQGPDNEQSQLKVAEILQLLAEISMESDNNAAAIADLEESLLIQEKYLQPDDRLLAETYYNKGLALLLNKQHKPALDDFNMTKQILELRVQNLKNKPILETAGGFEKADIEKEIEDLEGVLADIREKIEDTVELMRDADNQIKEAILKKAEAAEEATSKFESSGSSTKPVSNITHLLKRKKPEQEESKDSDAKRLKASPAKVQNGEARN